MKRWSPFSLSFLRHVMPWCYVGHMSNIQIHTLVSPNIHDLNRKLKVLIDAGKIDSARELFDQMSKRNFISWNTMLAGYWKRGNVEESKKLFSSMPERSVVSWNCMISGCFKNGLVEEALRYFDDAPRKDVASWNAAISGLVKHDLFDEAEKLFDEMPVLNVISYTAMMAGFAKKGQIQKARRLFDKMPDKNAVSWAAMINGYVDNGLLDEALKLFELMPNKSVVAYTVIISGYCKAGQVRRARQLFDEIREKDLISWNAMIGGYAENGNGEEALDIYRNMLTSGFRPDHATLIVVLTACSDLTSLWIGKQTHAVAVKTNLKSNIELCNALITMYSKCGSLIDSEFIFHNFKDRNLVSWNALIAAYAQHGFYEKVLAIVNDMNKEGEKPNGITFLNLLYACGHVGMIAESLALFNLMIHEYKVPPDAEHFYCLVDILGRAGKLDQAYHLLMSMPFEADCTVWSSFLGACCLYLNVELGELAARKIMDVDPKNSGAYVMLSNIYAAKGMWTDVKGVRMLMREQGVQKQLGNSWIEIGDKVHLFKGGDTFHPDICKIHAELDKIWSHNHLEDYFEVF